MYVVLIPASGSHHSTLPRTNPPKCSNKENEHEEVISELSCSLPSGE